MTSPFCIEMAAILTPARNPGSTPTMISHCCFSHIEDGGAISLADRLR
eukprot:CAMPEP_0204425658 /NCGR_PEP_ID=MMETSP0470-20130426/49935_1 /ASSEMBLY_ACC=CAM_ASM_000385 /TAXON_ID=2969 /ORGANISM="Oxyrrhis marina" /LENGTH=47 /DNA_ID= /DNA_START= /DNA_END= /DNA_ORIENTATION=